MSFEPVHICIQLTNCAFGMSNVDNAMLIHHGILSMNTDVGTDISDYFKTENSL